MKEKSLPLIFLTGCYLISGCEQKDNGPDLASYPKDGICSIDIPANNAEFSVSEKISIGGWAVNKIDNRASDGLIIYFKNTKTNELIDISAHTGYERLDVAQAFNSTSAKHSGFNLILDEGKLAPGTYEIVLVQLSRTTGAAICNGEPHIISIK
jgi:hypothetical protein